MLRFSLLFGVGVLLFHQLPRLPDAAWLVVELLVLSILTGWWRTRPWVALLAGFAWSHGYALIGHPAAMPLDEPVSRVVATGRIIGLPQRREGRTRFLFEVGSLRRGDRQYHGNWRLSLSWRNSPMLETGERWTLPLRVRAAHGYASPGAWDYEAWLYRQGIRYTAYVSGDAEPVRLQTEECCLIDRYRAHILARLGTLAVSEFSRGVLGALVVADRSGLTAGDKALFRDTGTSHLIAVSGLHIGLIGGLGMLLVGLLWRRLPYLCERIPARMAGAAAGMLVAFAYAVMAGMGLPTQRALIMLGVAATGLVMRRETRVLHGLAVALVLVLIWHPPSVVEAGLWLSFCAVLAIFAVLQWLPRRGRLRQLVLMQLAVTLCLWPVLVFFGLPASGIAPLANLLLVPLFSLLVVPWALGGVLILMVSPQLGAHLLLPLGWVLDRVQQGLSWASDLSWVLPAMAGSSTLLLCLGLGSVLLLMPPGLPLRWLGVPLLLTVLLPRDTDLEQGDFVFSLLDVGQGLSSVIETHRHTLVFDTGPAYPTGFNTANAVLVPYLRQRGIAHIDRLILSHGDSDHAGGVVHLKSAIPVKETLSGEPARVGSDAALCRAGERWSWDGVSFEILHPSADATYAGNNASCVLQVKNAAGTLLLTGDIERAVERRLAAGLGRRLQADVVVAPHHGSRSSSSPAFVRATAADHVLYAAGWANRYGFPAAEVDARWRAAGTNSINTAHTGTLVFRFAQNGVIDGPEAYRDMHRRIWTHDGGSATGIHAVSSGD